MSKLAQSYRDLEVYKDAFRLQQHIFQISKGWPAEERYALTDQEFVEARDPLGQTSPRHGPRDGILLTF